LDDKRLGKQRVETIQILNALIKPGINGWRNHPAVKMWRGHELALCNYGIWVCFAWVQRGFKDSCYGKIQQIAYDYIKEHPNVYAHEPPWLGNEELHASHRANLLRKDPDWYGQFGWTEDPTLPYVWPV
jgi:hypothetical protein